MAQPSVKIGDLEVMGVSDGTLKTSLDFIIGMDRALSEQLVGGSENGSLFIPVNNFVVKRDGKIILIDAGAGNTMQPTLGKLPTNLRAAGIDPATVTHILLTHMHPDHANGLVDDAGAPHYPNAEIVAHEREAEFWLAPAPATEPEPVKRNRARTQINMAPYLDRLRRVRDDEEVLGFVPVLAHGHTPGHTVWRLDAGRDALIAWGDLVHLSAIQISHPDAALTYDLDKGQASRSRRRILDMAATDRLLVAGAHINGAGLGYVVRKGLSYAYEPAV